nr:MAG TPA: hypothetical protein [Caudoviricetes sp.]
MIRIIYTNPFFLNIIYFCFNWASYCRICRLSFSILVQPIYRIITSADVPSKIS